MIRIVCYPNRPHYESSRSVCLSVCLSVPYELLTRNKKCRLKLVIMFPNPRTEVIDVSIFYIKDRVMAGLHSCKRMAAHNMSALG